MNNSRYPGLDRVFGKPDIIWLGEDTPDLYTLGGQAEAVAKASGIRVLSHKELSAVAVLRDKVVGALYTSFSGGSFDFDVAVLPEYQGRGIGRELIDSAIEMYRDYKSELGSELSLDVDITNPVVTEALKRRGFNVIGSPGNMRGTD